MIHRVLWLLAYRSVWSRLIAGLAATLLLPATLHAAAQSCLIGTDPIVAGDAVLAWPKNNEAARAKSAE